MDERAEIDEEVAVDNGSNNGDVANSAVVADRSECSSTGCARREKRQRELLNDEKFNEFAKRIKQQYDMYNDEDHLFWKISRYAYELRNKSVTMSAERMEQHLTIIRERVRSHPEEVRAKTEKHRFDKFLLHVAVRYPRNFPIDLFDELIRAFPAAVSTHINEGISPLGLLVGKHDEICPESNSGKMARLLLERMITPPSSEIANAMNILPCDIVKRHVLPYLGDPVAQLDSFGSNLLARLLGRRRKHNFMADDMIHRILDAVPISANPAPPMPGQGPPKGLLPLHMACVYECPVDIIQKLIEAYPGALHAESIIGRTALHICAEGDHSMIRHVIQSDPTVLSIQDEAGKTPLHIICAKGEPSVIRHAIQSNPGALSIQDEAGRTPLNCAFANVFGGRPCKIDAACIRLISQLNPQSLAIPDLLIGDLPLHTACVRSHFGHYDLSVDGFAALVDGYRDAITTINLNGTTPREYIEPGWHPQTEQILQIFDSV
mmetsp:Transcript_21842/g.32711  ORF Transcript_21842/g.32711 Transcript_21842/m.32711 type:complete len:492 (-) Transcript_21842:46-1521(-)